MDALTWRQRFWKNNAVPLMTSLTLHVGVVVVGLLCFAAFKTVHTVAVEGQAPILASSPVEPTQVSLNQRGDLDPLPATKVPRVSDTGHPGFVNNRGPIKISDVNPKITSSSSESVIGPSMGFQSGRPGASGSPGFSGGDDLPSFHPGNKGIFDGPGPGGGGHHGEKTGQPATSIAYVCDASGSMMEKMPALKRELTHAVLALRPFQKFSIIFFQDEQPTALSTKLLLPTPENKRAATAFLDDVSTSGSTDPIPGIKLAFAEHPQMMFLLTDGDFPNNDAVLAEIRALEKVHHVQVNTIAFTGSADNQTNFLVLLKKVAQETGGSFKQVDADALGAGN